MSCELGPHLSKSDGGWGGTFESATYPVPEHLKQFSLVPLHEHGSMTGQL